MIDVLETLNPNDFTTIHTGPPILYGVRVLPASLDGSAAPYRTLTIRYLTQLGEVVEKRIPDDAVYSFNTNRLEAKGDAGSYLFQVLDGVSDGVQLGAARTIAGQSVATEVQLPGATLLSVLQGVFPDNAGVQLGAKCSGVRVSVTCCAPDGVAQVQTYGAQSLLTGDAATAKLLAFRQENFGTEAAPVLRWCRAPELDLLLDASTLNWPSATWGDLPTPVRAGRILWRACLVNVTPEGGSSADRLLVSMRATNDS